MLGRAAAAATLIRSAVELANEGRRYGRKRKKKKKRKVSRVLNVHQKEEVRCVPRKGLKSGKGSANPGPDPLLEEK